VIPCDACIIYTLESKDLVLRASLPPHPGVVDRLTLAMGQGITGWVAEHREPVVVGQWLSAIRVSSSPRSFPRTATRRCSPCLCSAAARP
jgi:uroporphyrinogen-III synthase